MSTWNLDKVEKLAKIFSLVAMPILLGIGGYYLQNIISKRAANVAYTELAITILKEDVAAKRNGNLRGWATAVLSKTSPVDITESLQKELKDGTVTFPTLGPYGVFEWRKVAPANLLQCSSDAPVVIPSGELTRADTGELVARLRVSELSKSRCAEGWANWFSSIAGER